MKLWYRVVFLSLCLSVSSRDGIAQSAILDPSVLRFELDPVSLPRVDFDGDRKRDILWQHADGSSAIWLMNGDGGGLLGAGTGWSVKALGDFDGNGESDIVWQHTDGSSAIWLMNGVTISSGGNVLGAGTGWSVKAVGERVR